LIRPLSSRRNTGSTPFTRVNGKIRAREVRVIGDDGVQLGILPLHDALAMARSQGIDLVEIAPNATPPVCRLVDYGKYRYELSKKDKESHRHQHANKVKEVQLSPTIDPHDLGVKLSHAIDFLSDEMKVKVTLKFRGREMMHQEYGFQVVNRFIQDLLPYAHADAPPKLIGRGINVMLSPLPRNKRAKNPRQTQSEPQGASRSAAVSLDQPIAKNPEPKQPVPRTNSAPEVESGSENFTNNPFSKLGEDLNQH
jgi:translation initiation factor IF-3